ncbi:tetratricopeptide repeat protein [uncultured Sphingomonas sp.]|uniref:tetratricopeptide repeat protein n=1 Tax=uncultured Sphingomonas sp. TaxID=158754 RepID=UPI0035CAFA3E
MIGRLFISGVILPPALLLASACTSPDEKAGTAAAMAADALQQGRIATARERIGVALAARDDVGEYWLLSAHIAMAEQNYGGAFDAYESVLLFDRGNLEALTRLCQIALSADQPQRAERYADQLATLRPGDKAALTVKAALALSRSDEKTAARLLDQVLAADPSDALALIVKSRLLVLNDDYVGAARAAEASLAAPGDPAGRLNVLKGIYLEARNGPAYARTITRLARAYPESTSAQLEYAAGLYDAGDAASGFAVSRRVLLLRPGDVGVASAVLNLWIAQGTAAMPANAVVASAADGPLETKATYAQYANATGRPASAIGILGEIAARAPADTATANAKAARAHARMLLGAEQAAAAEVAEVLVADADHPRALVVRALLRAKAANRRGAIEDLRHALTGDPANASARLTLSELQSEEGDDILAAATLREGLRDRGADPRLATRLARSLRAQGQASAASDVLEAYARLNPFGRRPSV